MLVKDKYVTNSGVLALFLYHMAPLHVSSLCCNYVVSALQLENESSKTLEFDICLCTPGMLDKIKHLQKILRAKMPNFRRGESTLHR